MKLKQAINSVGEDEAFSDKHAVAIVSDNMAFEIPWRLAKYGEWSVQLTDDDPETVEAVNAIIGAARSSEEEEK